MADTPKRPYVLQIDARLADAIASIVVESRQPGLEENIEVAMLEELDTLNASMEKQLSQQVAKIRRRIATLKKKAGIPQPKKPVQRGEQLSLLSQLE